MAPATELQGAPWGLSASMFTSFELGEPFLPLEQLMAVLPPSSSDALPPPLARLMRDEDSPIADCFPRAIALDLNGASQSHKAVVLLPFLDAKKLRAQFAEEKRRLAPEDAARNRFGPTYLYCHHSDSLAAELWQLAADNARCDGFAQAKVVQPCRADRTVNMSFTPFLSVPRGSQRQPPSEAQEGSV